MKRVSNQTAAGKKRILSALVVVGNGNGVAGFGLGKAEEAFPAIRKVCLCFNFVKIHSNNNCLGKKQSSESLVLHTPLQ